MYKVGSLFAGVGGIDLGFEQTGKFKTIWANEFDKNALLTYKSNFSTFVSDVDIRKVKLMTFLMLILFYLDFHAHHLALQVIAKDLRMKNLGICFLKR